MIHAPTTEADGRAHPHEHLVRFYETEDFLVRSVAVHLAAALGEDDAAIAIATPGHLDAFATALARSGIDVEQALLDGRYLAIDALALLPVLMAGRSPDPDRFHTIVGALVDQAAAGGREVRIYGELVALLLDRGEAAATIAIEDLWNALARTHRFELLCGYPLRAFDNQRGSFEHICQRHAGVSSGPSFPPAGEAQEQQRLVAELLRDATTLRHELDALRREQADLIELAYHDPITGLVNRRAFDIELEREWSLAARGEQDSFVLIADLDDFKHVNDTHGHAAGDELLRAFGGMLRRAARGGDVVARIGGDEFGVLLVRCDERAAHVFRTRVDDAIGRHVVDRFGRVQASFGHASMRRSSSPATALDRADLAMIASKRARRRRRLGGTPGR